MYRAVCIGPPVDWYADRRYWAIPLIRGCFRPVATRNRSVTVSFDRRRPIPGGINRGREKEEEGEEGEEKPGVRYCSLPVGDFFSSLFGTHPDLLNHFFNGKYLVCSSGLEDTVKATIYAVHSLFRHMEGLTNEMERSNEMVMCLLVYILQERLEAKDCELRKLELLSQKEAAEERDDDDGDKEEANEGNSADVEA
ncbi:hypothetical protein GW17_00030174 [Ensete ventricosum]|nr:hypothetical protein GW17_00030174 [Ensete ventricosum]